MALRSSIFGSAGGTGGGGGGEGAIQYKGGDVGNSKADDAVLVIANDAVTNAKLRNSGACSVIGRSANSSGDPADISAGTNDRVFCRTGNALSFAQVSTAMIAAGAADNTVIADMAQNTLKGRVTASTGDPEDLTAAQAQAVLNTAARTVSNQQQALFVAEVDDGNSGASDTIDWTAGPAHKSTLTNNCTYTFTAPGGVTAVTLKIVQNATGGFTITWPAAVKNAVALNASLSTAASTTSIVSFYFDGANYWPGVVCTGVA